FLKIDTSGKRRLTISRRPDTVLHMAAKRTRTDRAQPFGVINEPQVFLDLRVPEIMPVTQVRGIHLLKELCQCALSWNLFIITPGFQTNPNIPRSGILDDVEQAVLYALQAFGRSLFAFLHGTDFHSHIFARKIFAGFRHRDQSISNWRHVDLSQMQYNERGA